MEEPLLLRQARVFAAFDKVVDNCESEVGSVSECLNKRSDCGRLVEALGACQRRRALRLEIVRRDCGDLYSEYESKFDPAELVKSLDLLEKLTVCAKRALSA